ncbi:nuclear transport factor 2 family protein [Dermatobacter hominis]|uniref:nuclear transport factor 2 family protein n=1 Tax=Dermatobacter hominis TaxID=2884263 RepID=UPI001D1146E8|nr:nuclear transport factor 2 family protein [Dermatobacter hominis]UDY34152.1 nuclear transport factor 2 family protein [Dermatobacter hominis]
MTTTTDPPRTDDLADLADRLALQELISGLGTWLDGHGGDPSSLYAPDVVASGPRHRIEGIDAVLARVGPGRDDGERSQHLHTDLVIALDGDRADITANQLVLAYREGEVPHRTAGLRVTYGARRQAEGWRIASAHIDLQWIIGDLPT